MNAPKIFSTDVIAIISSGFITVLFLIAVLGFWRFESADQMAGWIRPVGGIVDIRADAPARIRDIRTHVGAFVPANVILVVFDLDSNEVGGRTRSVSEIETLAEQSNLIDAQLHTRRDELETDLQLLTAQVEAWRAAVASAERRLEIAQRGVEIQRHRLDQLRDLLERGRSTAGQVQIQEIQYLAALDSVAQIEAAIVGLHGLIGNSGAQRHSIQLETQTMISELNRQRVLINGEIESSRHRGFAEIALPTPSVVADIHADIGQYVQAGELVLSAYRHNTSFEIVLLVPSSNPSQLDVGQSLNITFVGEDYADLGPFSADVRTISMDAVSPSDLRSPVQISEPVYRIVADFSNPGGSVATPPFELRPEMLVTAALATRDVNIFDLLISG